MNILYVAHFTTNIAAGPNWSVPARVIAQSKYDNVLLLNTTNVMMEHWKEVESFHNLSEFGELHLQNLPEPFSRPDMVVFEGFNFLEHVKFAKELRKASVPYIITPRGAMTYEAQHNHAWLKKLLAKWFFFCNYVKGARAIQYLTEGERDSSARVFDTPCFVLPNGFDEPKSKKTSFSTKGIKAVFIGRLDMYHKGIDLLFSAIVSIKKELLDIGFVIDIYGPKRYDYFKIEKEIQLLGIEDIARLHDEVGGKDKERVLLESDLFVMTSRLEGLPMGLLEALAYGVPCFITKGTNMKVEVEKFDAGWTCVGSQDDIKNALLKVISETKLLQSKSTNALILSQHYQWNDITMRFHEEIQSIINL